MKAIPTKQASREIDTEGMIFLYMTYEQKTQVAEPSWRKN